MTNQICFQLDIVSPTKKESFKVEWIDVQTPSGNFIIGPDHHDLVSILSDRGKLSYKKVGEEETHIIDIYGGFLRFQGNLALVIVDL